MRMLYVWNTAGVSSIINRYMGWTYGHAGTVVMRRSHDPYGISTYYGARVTGGGTRAFYLEAALRSLRCDILHVCAGIRYSWLKKVSGAKVVLHYHGSDARDVPFEKRKEAEEGADRILVSTPDLLEYRYAKEPVYVPNPVDISLFPPTSDTLENNRGLVLMKPGQDREDTLRRLRDLGFGDIQWDLAERSYDAAAVNAAQGRKTCGIQYPDMPALLSQYRYYGEIYQNAADGSWYAADSTTGLQAMSMWRTVVRHDGSVSSELPREHSPLSVAKQVRSIYDGLLGIKPPKLGPVVWSLDTVAPIRLDND